MYRVNIVLANNGLLSHTRLAIEYGNELVKSGHSVFISYPVVSFFDFLLFEANFNFQKDTTVFIKLKVLIKLLFKIFFKLLNPSKYKFLGSEMLELDKNIKLNRYLILPTEFNMPKADIILVTQDYLLRHLVSLPSQKGLLIGSVHSDYKMLDKNRSIIEMFYYRMILISRKISVPRYAVSKTAMISARSMGVNVDCVINNAVRIFPSENKKTYKNSNIKIMLFSSPRKEKGLSDGVKVIRKLKKMLVNDVSFCSIGEITPEASKFFDINYGFLTGDEYFRAISSADIFIYPSLLDGFAGPPLEAIACGCALVSTIVPGVDEWALNGQNCLIVEPGDLEGMTNSVIKLIENRELLAKLSRNGVQTAKKYTWSSQTQKLLELFGSSLERVNVKNEDKHES